MVPIHPVPISRTRRLFATTISVNNLGGGPVLDDEAVGSEGFAPGGGRGCIGDVPLELFHDFEAAGVHDVERAVLGVVFVESSLGGEVSLGRANDVAVEVDVGHLGLEPYHEFEGDARAVEFGADALVSNTFGRISPWCLFALPISVAQNESYELFLFEVTMKKK
jgi:hypothetical protein